MNKEFINFWSNATPSELVNISCRYYSAEQESIDKYVLSKLKLITKDLIDLDINFYYVNLLNAKVYDIVIVKHESISIKDIECPEIYNDKFKQICESINESFLLATRFNVVMDYWK